MEESHPPRELTPMDFVPREIEDRVAKYMEKWVKYLEQDRKDKHQEELYSGRLVAEADEETRKFYESELAALVES